MQAGKVGGKERLLFSLILSIFYFFYVSARKRESGGWAELEWPKSFVFFLFSLSPSLFFCPPSLPKPTAEKNASTLASLFLLILPPLFFLSFFCYKGERLKN